MADESQLPSRTETSLFASVGPLAVIKFSGPPGTGRMREASSLVNSSVRTRFTHEPLSMTQVRFTLREQSGTTWAPAAGKHMRAPLPTWAWRRFARSRAILPATLSASLVGILAGPLCLRGAAKYSVMPVSGGTWNLLVSFFFANRTLLTIF